MTSDSLPMEMPLARGDRDSREAAALYRELRKPMLRYLVCLGLSADEAQDVVQDAFVSLQRHLQSGGETERIRGWLFRVAHNRARNRQVSYDRRFGSPLDAAAELRRDEATPEGRVLAQERFRRLAAAVAGLAEQERECLLLRAGGLRYREIAEVLSIPISTVGDTVERAIKKLAAAEKQEKRNAR